MSEAAKRLFCKVLLAIVPRDMSDQTTKLIEKSHIHMQYQFRAEGTASSDILDVLGLDVSDKVVHLCIAPKVAINELLKNLADGLRLIKPGKGIAFTLPVSGIGYALVRMFSEEAKESIMKQMESDVNKVKCEATNDLVMAVINQGFTDELMDAAKKAGATGGTVVHSRWAGGKEAAKFWGITMQEEKELVLILVSRENKIEIMKAIVHQCGIGTEAQGLIFSLPIDQVAGL